MVVALVGDVERVALGLHVGVHGLNRRGLVVVWAHVHALHAETLVIRKELHLAKVVPLLGGCLALRPLHLVWPREVGQTDEGDPVEVLLAGVVHAV